MYELEELVTTFHLHAKKSIECNEAMKKEFIKNFPDEELPAHFNEDFNISSALAVICEEILFLKNLSNRKASSQ